MDRVNMKAYTYTIFHIPSGRFYYGVRKSDIEDIGVTYFSSSKLVKRMICEEPLINFIFKVRRRFESYEEARKHETNILKRLKVIQNPKFLNQAISSPRICSKDSISEIQRRNSISCSMKEKWENDEYKHAHPFLNLSKEERSRRGKITSDKRKEEYTTGVRKYKTRIKTYKDVTILKNGREKIVKANQVPAYKKYGWALKGL